MPRAGLALVHGLGLVTSPCAKRNSGLFNVVAGTSRQKCRLGVTARVVLVAQPFPSE